MIANAPDVAAALAAVIAGWRVATSRAIHPPGCGCCGGSAFVLQAGPLADDIAYSLASRYAAAGHEDLVALLDAVAAQPGENLPDRLARIAACADPDAAYRILSDALLTLNSIETQSRPPRLRAAPPDRP